ncbi:hypothetical protein AB0K48_48830 [Nonomuraea sp. NPDC055795]
MRALFHLYRPTGTTLTDAGLGISFDEARGEVCDTACRAGAAVERARTSVLTLR